jgi:hypothetical protein
MGSSIKVYLEELPEMKKYFSKKGDLIDSTLIEIRVGKKTT